MVAATEGWTPVKHVQNRHAVDRTGRIRAGRGISEIIVANHQRYIGLREAPIDVFHLDQLVAGDVGLGQDVPLHAANYGVARSNGRLVVDCFH